MIITGDRVDVYLSDDTVWTEGRVIRTIGDGFYVVKLDSVMAGSMERIIRTREVAPAGTHCLFDWRSSLRTPKGIGFFIEIAEDGVFWPAKVLCYTETTDEVLIHTSEKNVRWVDVDSPLIRMGWEW